MNRSWKNKILIAALFLVVGVLLCSTFVLAQGDLGATEVAGEAGLAGEADPRIIIARIIRIVFGFLGVIALALVIYGGFVWMTAGGDPEQVSKAKKILVNALIGLAIILLAFSITSFIINRLEEAAGLGVQEFQPGDGEGGIPGGGGPGSFKVKSIQPMGSIPIRNVAVRLTFNDKIDPNTAQNAVSVVRTSDGQPVQGQLSAAKYNLTFIPNSPCPEPNQNLFCFDANTAYTVRVSSQLKNLGGDNLSCGIASVCQAEFTTGELVDTAAPGVSLTSPYNNQAISEFSFFTLTADTNDDSGISAVEFYVDDQLVGADGPLEASTAFLAQLEWDNSDFDRGNHSVYAKAYDLDDNETQSSSKNFRILAEHCFDGQRNFDETGVDCGGADCSGCDGDNCLTDTDCATGICSAGVCSSYPTITGVSGEIGAAGNLLTIWGSGFGGYLSGSSKVEFSGAGQGLIEAGVACDDQFSWTSTQVVVKVPTDAQTGAIKLTNRDGYWDDTANDRGWIGEYTIDPVLVWPGLCSVVNSESGLPEGRFQDTARASGENMGQNGQVLFGTYSASFSGDWNDDQIAGIEIPNIDNGRTLVRILVGERFSNPFEFTILSAQTLPQILEIDPTSGGVGQYVTIKGSNFGSSPIPVFFIAQDGTEYLADTSFPDGCTDGLWSDNEILVKVPQAPASNYAVLIRGAEIESNTVPFTITNQAPAPGICQMTPNNGPIGTLVDVYGERLGPDGKFIFSNNIEAGISNATSDTYFRTQVAPLAVSGSAYYRSADNQGSNSMNFSVGSCQVGSCPTGAECCADGVCRASGACEAAISAGSCEYGWMFSTGQLPLIPQVIEDQTCDDDHNQSPSPWKNSVDACTNALIGARFNMEMQLSGVISKLRVERCRNQNETCSFNRCDLLDSDCLIETIDSISPGDKLSNYFVINSVSGANTLLANMNYRVTILGGEDAGIKGENGIALPKDYSWQFKTQNSPCEIANVILEPSKTTIKEYLGQKIFSVYGQSENCNILNVANFNWNWSISQTGNKAVIVSTENEKATVEAREETAPNQPAVVQASALVPQTGASQSDTADLTIDFTDPRVIDYGPNCDSACINTLVWAKFNTAMPDRQAREAISVYECEAKQCAAFSQIQRNRFNVEYNQAEKTLYVFGRGGFVFSPNRYYRVAISSALQSLSGVNLAGLNFDLNKDGINDSFSWVFKTKNDVTLCDMESAKVNPAVYESTEPGEKIGYVVEAVGTPDECNPNGQKINPYIFNWSWTSSNATVAEITGELFSSEFPKDVCSDNCLNIGSDKVAAICGNGIIEYGEECDDSNTDTGDGCAPICLHEPVTDVSNNGTCGNGIIDPAAGEECDYALNPDICTAVCQRAGSFFSGYECGNGGNPEPGEDCDDGNRTNGDGCSSNCLFEGSKYTAQQAESVSLCGNGGNPEPGEDCDDGNTDNGDGCSARCLAEGSANTCGNGVIDNGENCDDNNTVNGDGCSARCLLEGSSWSYGSFCGNSSLETGEACEAAVGSELRGSPVQLAEVIGSFSPLINSDSTDITARAKNIAGQSKEDSGRLTYTRSTCQAIPESFTTAPVGTAVCRNAAIQLTVNQPVQISGIADAINITYPCGTLTLLDKIKSFFADIKNKIISRANAQAVGETIEYSGTVTAIAFTRGEVNFSVYDQGREIRSVVDRALVPSTVWELAQQIDNGVSVRVIGTVTQNVPAENRIYVQVNNLERIIVQRPPFVPQLPRPRGVCSVPLRDINVLYDSQSSTSTITIYPEGLLAENTTYTVDYSGLRDHCGTLFGNNSYMFTTGDLGNICRLDYVDVVPGDLLVTSRNAETDYQAFARSQSLDAPINPVPGIYDWNWSWRLATDLDDVTLQDNFIGLIFGGSDDKKTLKTGTSNGQATVFAEASVSSSNYGDAGKTVEGLGNVTIFVCENLWIGEQFDPIINGVWQNSTFNFKTFYCRDAGNPGPEGDLPDLKIIEAPGFQGDPWAVSDPVVVKEYFLLRTTDTITPDAIAVRVYPNLEGVAPSIWYDLHAPNPGQYQQLDISCTADENGAQFCYQAVQDNRTVYVSAANFISGIPGLPVLSRFYDNVFVISYSENSNPETVAIFSQLLENLKFNTNQQSGETINKIKRDLKRFHDITFIRSLINTYRSQNGRWPLLAADGQYVAGTYAGGQSISTWPSWNAVFGNVLGSSLPQDPINNFGLACTPPSPEKYDQLTCYNSQDQIFYGDYDASLANVYDYRLTDNNQSFEIKFNPELYTALRYPDICALSGVVCQ
ncbi:MAG: Ig-like domain-containing protein [Patescibacteria group bacterium]